MKRGGEIIVRRGRPIITEDTTQLITSSIASSASRIAYLNFINSLKSKETKRKYIYLFAKYLEYLNISYEELASTKLLKRDIRTIESDIILYMTRLKDEKGYSFASLNTSLAAITLFFTMNDIIVNRKKIGKYLGEHIKTIKDRGYTHDEIKKMLDVSDLKFKVFITLMASTGCRVGAIPSLKIRNIKYYKKYSLYQITFYENTKSEYYSFTTPECANYIKEYLEYRSEVCGEKINDNSLLIRDDFVLDDMLHIQNPKHLSIFTFNYYLRLILIKTGIRKVIPLTESQTGNKKNRKVVSQNHGFRKFTHTTMANKRINPEIREMLLGHKIGLSSSYYRPSESELLEEYLKVIDDLTINDEFRLSKQVQELKEKNQDSEYVIKGKLPEKEEQIKVLMTQVEKLNKETNRNRQEFIDIANQIQEIKNRTKIDPDTRKRIKTGEMGRDEMFELYLQDRERKKQQQQELEQQLQKYNTQQ